MYQIIYMILAGRLWVGLCTLWAFATVTDLFLFVAQLYVYLRL